MIRSYILRGSDFPLPFKMFYNSKRGLFLFLLFFAGENELIVIGDSTWKQSDPCCSARKGKLCVRRVRRL